MYQQGSFSLGKLVDSKHYQVAPVADIINALLLGTLQSVSLLLLRLLLGPPRILEPVNLIRHIISALRNVIAKSLDDSNQLTHGHSITVVVCQNLQVDGWLGVPLPETAVKDVAKVLLSV